MGTITILIKIENFQSAKLSFQFKKFRKRIVQNWNKKYVLYQIHEVGVEFTSLQLKIAVLSFISREFQE